MNYLTQTEGIEKLRNLLMLEQIIPIFGSGFSGKMPCRNGTVPIGNECTNKIKDLLGKHSFMSTIK